MDGWIDKGSMGEAGAKSKVPVFNNAPNVSKERLTK